MNNIVKSLSLAIVIAVVALSCDKRDPVPAPCPIKSVEHRDSKQTLLFLYNFNYADNRIVSVQVFDSQNTPVKEWKIEYNTGGQISQYQYTNLPSNGSSFTESIEYGSDGIPVRTTKTYIPDYFGYNGTFPFTELYSCESSSDPLGGRQFDTKENKIGKVLSFLSSKITQGGGSLYGNIVSPPCKNNIIRRFSDSGLPYHGYYIKTQTSFEYEFNSSDYPTRITYTVAVQTPSKNTSETEYFVFEYNC